MFLKSVSIKYLQNLDLKGPCNGMDVFCVETGCFICSHYPSNNEKENSRIIRSASSQSDVIKVLPIGGLKRVYEGGW